MKNFAFTKINYILLLVGMVIIVIGFIPIHLHAELVERVIVVATGMYG